MKTIKEFCIIFALSTCTVSEPAQGHTVEQREEVRGTATVTASIPVGSPRHLASGFLYGIPIRYNQVPSHFYTEMGFDYGRAGGGSEPAPARGWAFGKEEFINRFASSISYYRTCREYGARMQLLIADLWGADGTAQIAMPGDDGDWSSYDEFLNTLTQSVYENNMSEFLDLDIWNEPDLPDLFWQRNQSQYLQMWGRGYYRLREAFPFNNLVGPSSSSSPRLGNTWMEAFLEFIKANASVPDMYSWHLERSGDDLQITLPEFRTLRQDYQLPDRPITCNEYATEAEQQPAGSAWYISRLERYGIQGLRGNWAPNGSYDYFAGLLGKPHAETAEYNASQAGYWNNGEYNVYKYYKMNMTGTKVNTSGSADRLFDVYATMSDRNGNGPAVKMICGPRLANGTWDILVTGLNRAGLPPSGSIAIRTIEFDFQGGALGDVPFPTDLGIHRQSYRDNELTITVETVATRAFAFELLGPQS